MTSSYNTYSNDKSFYPERLGRVCYDCGHFLPVYSRSDYRSPCEILSCPCMSRKDNWLDAAFLQLEAINIYCCLEIDTKDGYEYHKITSYRLDNDGWLIAVFSDAGVLHRVAIAKTNRLGRSNPYLVRRFNFKRKKEATG